MKIDARLLNAITALDLSSFEVRYGAVALVIFLLEKIWHEEAKEPGRLEKYFYQIEYEYDVITEDDDLRDMQYAILMLYRTYGFRHYRRLGISDCLRKIDASISYI